MLGHVGAFVVGLVSATLVWRKVPVGEGGGFRRFFSLSLYLFQLFHDLFLKSGLPGGISQHYLGFHKWVDDVLSSCPKFHPDTAQPLNYQPGAVCEWSEIALLQSRPHREDLYGKLSRIGRGLSRIQNDLAIRVGYEYMVCVIALGFQFDPIP